MFADISTLMAETWLGIRAFSFSKTEVDKDSTLGTRIVEKVCRLDISVKDLVVVHTLKCSKKFSQIDRDLRDGQIAKVCSKVSVSEVWKDSHNLICFSEGGDKRAD